MLKQQCSIALVVIFQALFKFQLVTSLTPFRTNPSIYSSRNLSRNIIYGRHSIYFVSRAHDVLSTPSASIESSTDALSLLDLLTNNLSTMDQTAAEAVAAPFFGLSLFPYLAFIFFLQVPQNNTPKGVIVGFATCLLFVLLTIPAAVAAKIWYGVSLADCDWLHGSAESVLMITNLVTVVAFRQAFTYQEQVQIGNNYVYLPESIKSYSPMIKLVLILTGLALLTAILPAFLGSQVHTPYLNGFLDIPTSYFPWSITHSEPENALTIACWIVHITSLVEFLIVMGFCWKYAEITNNSKWKGLTWGLLPLHSSAIIACTYHLFYNSIPVLLPMQAFLTCVGNVTAMIGAYRIAKSNGWDTTWQQNSIGNEAVDYSSIDVKLSEDSKSLLGFEDLGVAFGSDNDVIFILKLFVGCTLASYIVKYGEVLLDFPFESHLNVALALILVPTFFNAFKWYKRGQDATFKGWL